MGKATRQAFGESLAAWGEKRKDIVVLDADLAKSTKSEIFGKKFPDRFYEMGISEANMIGAAAGLSFAGKLPFLCSFGCFITGRYDTIRLSASYSQANIRIIGTHAGIGIGDDGHSQMGLEDITLMRALPKMGVFQPVDARETELIMEYLIEKWHGPAYMRLTRQNVEDLTPAGAKWEPLKINRIHDGGTGIKKIACFVSGAVAQEAIIASEKLSHSGIAMTVWNAHCLKPFDDAGVITACQGADFAVTVEDHSVIGGLGTCVAEALAHLSSHTRLLKIGVQDTFGESGEPAELYEKFGLSASQIEKRILSAFG